VIRNRFLFLFFPYFFYSSFFLLRFFSVLLPENRDSEREREWDWDEREIRETREWEWEREMPRVKERPRDRGERIRWIREWETRRGRREIRPLRGPVPGGWCWVVAGRAKADDQWNPGAPTVKPWPRTRPCDPKTREEDSVLPVHFPAESVAFYDGFAMKTPWGKFLTTYDDLFWDWFDYCEIRVWLDYDFGGSLLLANWVYIYGYCAIRSVYNVDDLRNYCSWLGVLDSWSVKWCVCTVWLGTDLGWLLMFDWECVFGYCLPCWTVSACVLAGWFS